MVTIELQPEFVGIPKPQHQPLPKDGELGRLSLSVCMYVCVLSV